MFPPEFETSAERDDGPAVGRYGRPVAVIVAVLLFAVFWCGSVGMAVWGIAHQAHGGKGGDVAGVVFWTAVIGLLLWRVWRGGRSATAFMARIGMGLGLVMALGMLALFVLSLSASSDASGTFALAALPGLVSGACLLTGGILLRRREVTHWVGPRAAGNAGLVQNTEFRPRRSKRSALFFGLLYPLVLIAQPILIGGPNEIPLAVALLLFNIAVYTRGVRVRTVLTEHGVAYFELGHFWQWRPAFVPWTEVAEVGVGVTPRNRHVVLHLADGTDRWLLCPSLRSEKGGFGQAVARFGRPVRQRPATRPRARPWVIGAMAVVMAASVVLAALPIVRLFHHPPSVRTCEIVPAASVRRLVPQAPAKPLDSLCTWGSLQVTVQGFSGGYAHDNLTDERRDDEVEHVIHRIPGLAAYYWVAEDSSDIRHRHFTAGGRAAVRGYQVTVNLGESTLGDPAAPVADLIRAVVERLEKT